MDRERFVGQELAPVTRTHAVGDDRSKLLSYGVHCAGCRLPVAGCRGFTLTEVLVTIGILGVVMGLITYPMVTGFSYLQKGSARADVQSQARLAMETMARELAEAMYVFDQPALPATGRPDRTILAFILPERDSSGRVIQPLEPQPTSIRYWRALRRWDILYAPYYSSPAQVNPAWAARTEVDSPWLVRPSGLVQAVDPDYPWVDYSPPPPPQRFSAYYDRVVPLTPGTYDWDVPTLTFDPARIENDVLVPSGANYSSYQGKYPLWESGSVNVRVIDGDPLSPTYNNPVSRTYTIDYERGEVRFAQPGAAAYDGAAAVTIAGRRVIPGSETVTVDEDGIPVTANPVYARVASDPSGRQYTLTFNGTDSVISFDPVAVSSWTGSNTGRIGLVYQWRDNEDSDRVMASYATKALINIGLTLSHRDRAQPNPQKSRQEVHLSAQVRVRNVVR